jgi:hypothetical protein
MFDSVIEFKSEIIKAIEDKVYSLFSTRQSGAILESDAEEIYQVIIDTLEDQQNA